MARGTVAMMHESIVRLWKWIRFGARLRVINSFIANLLIDRAIVS